MYLSQNISEEIKLKQRRQEGFKVVARHPENEVEFHYEGSSLES